MRVLQIIDLHNERWSGWFPFLQSRINHSGIHPMNRSCAGNTAESSSLCNLFIEMSHHGTLLTVYESQIGPLVDNMMFEWLHFWFTVCCCIFRFAYRKIECVNFNESAIPIWIFQWRYCNDPVYTKPYRHCRSPIAAPSVLPFHFWLYIPFLVVNLVTSSISFRQVVLVITKMATSTYPSGAFLCLRIKSRTKNRFFRHRGFKSWKSGFLSRLVPDCN